MSAVEGRIPKDIPSPNPSPEESYQMPERVVVARVAKPAGESPISADDSDLSSSDLTSSATSSSSSSSSEKPTSQSSQPAQANTEENKGASQPAQANTEENKGAKKSLAASLGLTNGPESKSSDRTLRLEESVGFVTLVLKLKEKKAGSNESNYLFKKLESAGFTVSEVKGVSLPSSDVVFVVQPSYDLLLRAAEDMELLMKNTSGAYKTFKQDNAIEFIQNKGDDGNQVNFESGTQLALVHNVLERMIVEEGEEMDKIFPVGDNIIKCARSHGLVTGLHPLHAEAERDKLEHAWVKFAGFDQPIEAIRRYFGEQVAFYFGFLGSYTRDLIIPSALGGLVFLYQLLGGVDNLLTVFFSLLLTAWATVFLEKWKRRQARLAWKWGVYGADEQDDLPRAGFEGKLTFNPRTNRKEKVFQNEVRAKRVVSTGAITALCCLLVAIIVWITLEIQTYIDEVFIPSRGNGAWTLLSYLVTIIYVSITIVLEMVYNPFAAKLTDFENWRTEAQFRNALILKLVVFHFVSNFLFLFYYTFYLQDIGMLRSQIIFLLGIRQVIGNVQETLLPYYLAKRKQKKFKSMHEEAKDDPKESSASKSEDGFALKIELEESLNDYDDTFYDYLELFVQFGNVTMFAAAFPLSPALALLNNFMEIRSDALKVVKGSKRPLLARCSGIGAWMHAFEALGYIAVITNCGIIGLSSTQVHKMLPGSTSPALRVIAFVVLEHVMIAAKLAIDKLTDDVPAEIREELKYQSEGKKGTVVRELQVPKALLQEDEGSVSRPTIAPRKSPAKSGKQQMSDRDLDKLVRDLNHRASSQNSSEEMQSLIGDYQKNLRELSAEVKDLRQVVNDMDVGDIMRVFHRPSRSSKSSEARAK